MHSRSLRRALLPAVLAASLFPAAAAHATPPGSNGPLFAQRSESGDYAMLDATKGIDYNTSAPTWPGGSMLGTLRSSPDGQHVAYFSVDDDRIAIGDVSDGAHMRLLGGTAGAHALAFSPDGTKLAFTTNNKVYTVPADGSALPTQLGGTLHGAWELDWGANDGGLVVAADGATLNENDLYKIDLQTGAATPLTQTAAESEGAFSFDPDGTRLVVASDPVAFGPKNHLDIINADGSGRHAILTEEGVDTPQFSPDGTRIGFITQGGVDGDDVGTIAPDGTQRHAVANLGAVAVAWPMAQGTGNRIPTADFTTTPVQPYTTGDTTLTSTSADPDGTISSTAWDLDGDGQYDDATGAVVHYTFTTAGAHRIGVKVKDNRGATAAATKTIDVLVGGTPGASFTVDPANPTIGEVATFTAAPNADPHAHVVHTEWDFDGDGTWDADTGTGLTATHAFTKTGSVTARLRVTDEEGDSAIKSMTFTVKDVERCGTEQVGELQLDGCLIVKGNRRIAPNGVTVNGFRLDATPDAIPVFDVAQYRAATVPASQTALILNGDVPIPDKGTTVGVSTSCGAAVGTSPFALKDFKDDDQSAPFKLNDGVTIAAFRVSGNSSLDFRRGGAKFDFDGLFPNFLLNWAAYGHGSWAVGPDCHQEHVTVRLGTFASRFIQFPEFKLERIDTNKWTGTLDLTVKGFKTVSASATAVDGRVRALTFNMGDAAVLPGTLLHAGSVTLRLDQGNEQLTGRGTLETQPLFGHSFLAVEGSISLGRDGLHMYGMAKAVGIGLGWVTFDVNTSEGYADLEAELDMKLGPAYVEGSISGYLQPKPFAAELYGDAKAGIDGIGHIGVDALLSTKGVAACGHVSFGIFGSASPGFSYRWGDTFPKVFLSSCDFGSLRVARTAFNSAVAGSKRVRTVSVADGQRAVVIVARGPRGKRAPRVALIGPHGQRITSKANGKATKKGRFLVIPNKQDGTTNFMIMKPAAGTWRVKPLGGSTLRQVGTAAALPAVSVKAKYTKKRKALAWTLKAIKGQSVKLVEVHADGTTRVLKTTNKSKGTIKYVPAAGAKQIVAEVTQNGLMRARKVVVRKLG
jgi:PKD domain/WD40-like Beta Propeller Repeat